MDAHCYALKAPFQCLRIPRRYFDVNSGDRRYKNSIHHSIDLLFKKKKKTYLGDRKSLMQGLCMVGNRYICHSMRVDARNSSRYRWPVSCKCHSCHKCWQVGWWVWGGRVQKWKMSGKANRFALKCWVHRGIFRLFCENFGIVKKKIVRGGLACRK